MAEQWYLTIDGIDGESTHARHPKAIDVVSWSFGASRAEGAGGGGRPGGAGGTGRATLEPFTFEAAMSVATPRLFKACVTGARHESATLTGVRGNNGFDFVTYQLTDVTVTSSRHGDGQGGAATDRFTLGFRSVTITYRPQRPTGGAGPAVSVTYSR